MACLVLESSKDPLLGAAVSIIQLIRASDGWIRPCCIYDILSLLNRINVEKVGAQRCHFMQFSSRLTWLHSNHAHMKSEGPVPYEVVPASHMLSLKAGQEDATFIVFVSTFEMFYNIMQEFILLKPFSRLEQWGKKDRNMLGGPALNKTTGCTRDGRNHAANCPGVRIHRATLLAYTLLEYFGT
ncbi:hypothetical protein OPV22_012444 [Ensete ventricosum]|uniref:Uncharacterized protein n=1 Tax=Ensete ventricosum TaxID=4639 RepID=A0AAV8R509_ENSVE|nr:hypothetical protein OPV22_012444 [Ensete ventricosum]